MPPLYERENRFRLWVTERMNQVEKDNRPEIGPHEFDALSTTAVYAAMITESYTEDRRNRSMQLWDVGIELAE